MNPLPAALRATFWLFVGLFIGLLIVNSRAADAWDATDKTLAAIAVTAAVIDWGQTRTIARNPDTWYERNNLMGPHPTVGEVDKHFAVGIVAGALIAHFLPATARKWFLGGVAAIEIGVVANNHSIGIRVDY